MLLFRGIVFVPNVIELFQEWLIVFSADCFKVIIGNDKFHLTFTIMDAHGRARYAAAYAARGRREVHNRIKDYFAVCYKIGKECRNAELQTDIPCEYYVRMV